MAPTDLSVQEQRTPAHKQRVANDFSLQVATVNGSGSQTANLVLLRSILLMGVPVSGKNMFPSNIAGLPTWYTIRASKRGYVGRKKEVDFLVAMKAETAREDVVPPERGAALIDDGGRANMLGIDMALMEKALAKQLGKKAKAVALNSGALKAGWDYAEANLTKHDPYARSEEHTSELE